MRHRISGKGGVAGRHPPAISHTEIEAGDLINNVFVPASHSPTLLALLLAVIVLALPAGEARCHEIPTDVVIQSYLKPGSAEAELLLRVPLEAMRDVDIPLRGPGYLDIAAADRSLEDAAEIWLANFIRLYADGSPLDEWRIDAVRVSLPSDRSFASYERALAHVMGPRLPADTELFRDQALLDVRIVYPGGRQAAEYAIDPDLGRLGLRTTTVLHFLPGEGIERVFEFRGSPGLVPLDPRWHQAFLRFIGLGVDHIIGGVDHLLFVMCLIIPFRRLRPLIAIVTSFTVAHSITLIASAFGIAPRTLWFPPLIETLIALSIVYMAIENVVGSRWERRWVIAFAFGLVHGFGFSFALAETLQFAGSHLLTSLLAFNLGVELGQLAVILIAVPVLNLLFRRGGAERIGTIILSVLLAHSGWHWMTDRAGALAAYSFSRPAIDAAFFAALLRWLMLALIIGLALWLLYHAYGRFVTRTGQGEMPR